MLLDPLYTDITWTTLTVNRRLRGKVAMTMRMERSVMRQAQMPGPSFSSAKAENNLDNQVTFLVMRILS